MLSNDIKEKIIDLRTQNVSFRDISDIIETEYGVKRTPQAIQRMHARLIEKPDISIKDRITCDAVNVYALGYNFTQVHQIITSKFDVDISYSTVVNIIKDNPEYLQNITKTLTMIIDDNVDEDADTLKSRLEYNGIKITNKKFNELVFNVFNTKINNMKGEYIDKASKLINDNSIIRQLTEAN